MAGLSSIDCHMPEIENEKGEAFMSHQWTSPLKDIEASSCFTCHTNETGDSIIAMVDEALALAEKGLSLLK